MDQIIVVIFIYFSISAILFKNEIKNLRESGEADIFPMHIVYGVVFMLAPLRVIFTFIENIISLFNNKR